MVVSSNRERILDVAIEVLGENPDAGMGDIANAAGVVRRTVYGHFPTRAALISALTRRAVTEMTAVLDEIATDDPEAAWVEFVSRLWPLIPRYRVLVVLRRSEYGDEIHALLTPVDRILADLVARGQRAGVFARHLPAEVIGQIAYAAVFTVADSAASGQPLDGRAATVASLLVLGVAQQRAVALVDGAVAGPTTPDGAPREPDALSP